MFSTLGALKIVVDAGLQERRPHPKSPARARRRARRGFPQHYAWFPLPRAIAVGDRLFMHPEVYDRMRQQVAELGHQLGSKA